MTVASTSLRLFIVYWLWPSRHCEQIQWWSLCMVLIRWQRVVIDKTAQLPVITCIHQQTDKERGRSKKCRERGEMRAEGIDGRAFVCVCPAWSDCSFISGDFWLLFLNLHRDSAWVPHTTQPPHTHIRSVFRALVLTSERQAQVPPLSSLLWGFIMLFALCVCVCVCECTAMGGETTETIRQKEEWDVKR